MKHTLLIILVTALTFNDSYADARNLMNFVPKGWFIKDSAVGDLNNDKIPDVAIVIQRNSKNKIVDSFLEANINVPRTLLILFGNSDNTYKLGEKNQSIIISRDGSNMDDPFQNLYIKNKVLIIEMFIFYNAGGWETMNLSYKFQFRNKAFALIGAEFNSTNRGSLDYENYSINFLTSICKIDKGNYDKETSKKTLVYFKSKKLRTLRNILTPFSWEVIKGVRI